MKRLLLQVEELKAASRSKLTLQQLEKNYIIEVLEITNWRVSGDRGAAKILGLNSKTLDSKMRKLKITRSGKNSSI
jgi:transcriptional regulator with GAF, ATPase, and Fis domain